MLNTFYLMSISSAIDNFKSQFDLNFIQKDRWRYMLQGLGNTLTITAVAAIIGIVLGVIIAAVRSSYDKNEESLKLRGGFSYHLLKFLNGICKIYLTIIRGTPVVVQLLICYSSSLPLPQTVLPLRFLRSESTRAHMLPKYSEAELCQSTRDSLRQAVPSALIISKL